VSEAIWLIKAGPLALVVLFSLAAPVTEGSLEDALDAYDRGDYPAALRIFRPLAQLDSDTAYAMLGLMYTTGHGVSRDDNVAMNWFIQAANRGAPEGPAGLGLMYEYGRGVSVNYVQAYKWYSIAAASVPAPEKMHAQMIEYRDRVAAKMTLEQISEAQKFASEWKPTSQ
jgi:uncharacterized protein